jgi:hypothetical protein
VWWHRAFSPTGAIPNDPRDCFRLKLRPLNLDLWGVDGETEAQMKRTFAEHSIARKAQVRQFNDSFRAAITNDGIMLSEGVKELPIDVRAMAIRKVATFDAFSADNDPHGEHDFGGFDLAGKRFFWQLTRDNKLKPELRDDMGDATGTGQILAIRLSGENWPA